MNTGDQDSSAGEQGRGGDASGSGNQRSSAAHAAPRRRGWRLEIGIFVRKIVNRRVVSYWQFPRGRRVRAGQVSGGGQPALQQASTPPPPTVQENRASQVGESQPVALRSTAAPDDSNNDGSTSEETSFEAGFFLLSVSPPEYPTEPVKE